MVPLRPACAGVRGSAQTPLFRAPAPASPRWRLLLATALCGLAVATPRLAAAEPDGAPVTIRVLFVGNSFTHGKFVPVATYNNANTPGGVTDLNFGQPLASARAQTTFGEPRPLGGIPGIFKKFTGQAGLTYDVQLETCSGKSLAYHFTNALSVIAQPQWDVVIMQDLSTGPVPVNRGGDPTTFITAVNQLETAIHQQNPAARVYLYQTWARADLTYLPSGDYFGQPIETMFNDLRDGYQAAFAQNANLAGIIPAGEAWLRAMGSQAAPSFAIRNPYTQLGQGMNLWGVDHYHPSRYGAYLNALMVLGTVAGVDPLSLDAGSQVAGELGMLPSESLVLRQTAHDQLVASGIVLHRPAGPPASAPPKSTLVVSGK